MIPADISAVIVTKGDVDLSPILASLPFDDVVIWDNSKEPVDRRVYGRYLGIERAKHEFIYVQDDDCIVPARAVVALTDFRHQWDVRLQMICNVPSAAHREYYTPLGMSLIGWGALFHRDLTRSLDGYLRHWPLDELFERECDRVFTALNRFYNVDFPIEHLPHAHGRDRMGTERRHGKDLAEIRKRIARVKASTSGELSEANR